MPIILKRLFQIKNILILIALLLSAEILLRITSPKPYEIEYPHSWETNFQYDSYFGWVGKPNFIVDLKPLGFENIASDHRGFPIIPNIKNDKIKNEKRILFIGKCDTFGGPMIGVEKGFTNLLAQESADLLDFDVIGLAGYSFYQEYLLNQKYNAGGNSLVLVTFCPFFDFYSDTEYFMYRFGNRRVPRPRIDGDTITHDPVPYIKSYWEYKLPWSERFSFREKLFLNCYTLSKIMNRWIAANSFDVDLAKHIVKQFQRDVKKKGGKLALLIFNECPDVLDPHLTTITDDFVAWLAQNNVGVIDVRRKLVGCSLAQQGDPTHINFDGQKIIKNELLSYLRNNGLVGD